MLNIIAVLQNCKPAAVFNFTLFLNCHIIQLLEIEFHSTETSAVFSHFLTISPKLPQAPDTVQYHRQQQMPAPNSLCVFSPEQSKCIMKSWVCNETS